MKKILSLLALMMLCVTGANAEKVIYSWPGGDQANSITLAEGVTVQITGNTSKNIQGANKVTVNGTEYVTMKVSNGAQNTLTLPKKAKGITFYSYINKASEASGLRDSYWKEVAGVNYDAETSGGLMGCYSDGDKTNPDVRSYSFDETDVITFTNAGEQLCYVMEVEYAEPAVPSKAVFLIPNAWDDLGATERYAAWAWAGELGAWFDFENFNGVYATAIPTYCTGLIIVRMDGNTTENNWDNKWNQTANINFTEIADNTVFTMTSMDGAYTTIPFSEFVQEAQAYMATFNKDAATALNPLIADLVTELNKETKDFNAIKAAIKKLVEKADPFIKAGIEKVEGYAVDIADETLNIDIAAIKAAYAAKDFAKLIACMKVYEQDFIGVANRYVAKAEAIDTTGKEGAEELANAISAVKAQLAAFASDPNIMQLGLAVRNLVIAMRAFEEANTTYTVAGNIEAIFGTAWAADATANDMTKGADGIWTKVYENVALEAGTIEYKVVKNHSWDNTSYGFDGNNATYEIKSAGTAETITFTFDPNAEGNKVSCAVKMADSDLMAEARALAAEDGVAVGKLLQAIAYAEAGDETGLQAAIDQYKDDNKDQEKDETAKVNTSGWKKYDGTNAGVCQTQFAPAIDTYDGRLNVKLAEVYEEGATAVNRTGTIIYQDITGLTNGQYKVGFYGNAFFTDGRGFTTTMEDGANDVAYVFANDQKEFITARIATSTTENNFRQFDVEVTDGQIKLGMGKENPGTNWHTMQIYQLTWFTTAKTVYDADQAELAALLAEAKALAADETKTEGKDELNAAIATAEEATTTKANWYNIPEIEDIIANFKTTIANFKKANWFIEFAAGEYYIIDAESGLMMAAGHNWGTRGIVNEMGLDLTLTPYTESRTVTINSRVSNGGNSHFLGENLYMDSNEWGWALEYQGFGFYILEPNSEKYINIDAENNLVLSDTPREWIIVTKEGVMAQLMEEMANATAENPVDATRLIVAQNFNRNDARNAEAWVKEQTLTGEGHTTNLSGGNNVNNCAEAYHTGFSFTQTITDAPAGLYKLTAQGFYRQDGENAEDAPVFFIGSKSASVPVKTGEEGNMSAASESFTNGLYTIEPIEFKLFADGDLVIGIKGTAENQWVIFDNFKLEYYGPATADFYVAGGYNTTDGDNEDIIFGTSWNPTLNKMTANADGTYTWLKSKVDLTAGNTIYYKVVADSDWDYVWGFGDDNADYIVGADDNYDVVITFNPSAKLDNGYNLTCTLNEGGTTGINDIATETVNNGAIYNLNGQRVVKAQKGLYIINGRKQIVK